MNLFGYNIKFERRSTLENPQVPISDPAALAMFFGDSWGTEAGVNVTTDRALGVPAIWAAVNFISDTIASLPLSVYQRTDTGTESASGDPVHRLLHDAPNAETTSFRWRKLMMSVVLTTGRHVTFIERSPSGRVINLWPLDPAQVTVERVAGRVQYRVAGETALGSGTVIYSANEVLDIPFLLSGDGLTHRDPLHQLRNAIGLTIALEGYASKFFQGGGVPPMQLVGNFQSPTGAERAAFDVSQAIKNARAKGHNVLPLPTGHELKALGFDPEKGQLVEARRFQIEEIARIYGLPPVFLQDLSRATFTNAEQQDLHLVKHLIMHWVKAIEQEINLKLFNASRDRFAEFKLDGLLRGDFTSRMQGYATAVQNAVRTPNEIRALENLPPLDGGDDLMVQGATVALKWQVREPAMQEEPVTEPEVDEDDDQT